MSESVFLYIRGEKGAQHTSSYVAPTWAYTTSSRARNSPGPPGAAPLRAPGDAHTKSPAPLYLYTHRRYKTDIGVLSPFSFSHPAPRRSSAAATAAVRFRSSVHRRRRESVECPQIRIPALRLSEAEARRRRTRASHGAGPEEEELLGGRRGGA